MATATTSAVAGDRINIKKGTYNFTGVNLTNNGTQTNPIIYRGYDTIPGDGYLGRSGGELVITKMPTFNLSTNAWAVSKAFTFLECLNIAGAQPNPIITISSSSSGLRAVRAVNSSTDALAAVVGLSTGVAQILYDCDLELSGATGGTWVILSAVVAGGELPARIIGCRIRVRSGTAPGIHTGNSTVIIGNTIFGCSKGINIATTGGQLTIANNTIVKNTSDGIFIPTMDKLQCIINNIITDNGGYGINCQSAAVPPFVANNRMRDNVLGDSPVVDLITATNYGTVTTDTGGPETDFVDYANNDFRLVAGSLAREAGLPSPLSIGALQPEAGGGGESSYAFVG